MTTAPFQTTFTFTPAGDRLTVEIFGDLTHVNRQRLRQDVLDWLERGARRVVLDLSRCLYIDSSGLGVLVSLSKRLKDAGGTLELVQLSDEMKTLFELTRLDTLFVLGGLAR